jgi:hypothetical protein
MSRAEHNYRKNKRDSNIRECFCKDDTCSDIIIDAHSLSQSATLDLIKGATTSGDQVILLNEISLEKGEVINKPIPQGWKKEASIFNGFCEDHDREIFKPIEARNSFDNTDEQCFLHSLRSFAYSYHKHRESEKFSLSTLDQAFEEGGTMVNEMESQTDLLNQLHSDPNSLIGEMMEAFKGQHLDEDSIKKIIRNIPGSETQSEEEINKQVDVFINSGIFNQIKDSNLDFENIDIEEIKRNGVEPIKDKFQAENIDYQKRKEGDETLTQIAFEPIKKKLVQSLRNKEFNKLQYLVKIERNTFPFATAGSFYPRIIDENKSSLVIINNEEDLILPCIMVTVIPDKFNRTMIILSCLKDDLNSSFYLKKLGSMKDNVEFQKAITGIILNSCTDNTFFNPDFWKKLCVNDEDKLIAREVSKKRPLDKLDEKPYLASVNLFDKKNAFTPPTSQP